MDAFKPQLERKESALERITREDRERGWLGFMDHSELKNELAKVDPEGKLAPWNDWLQGRQAPPPENAKHLVLKDVIIQGKSCDVYHWDMIDGKKDENSSGNRIFIHVKEPS